MKYGLFFVLLAVLISCSSKKEKDRSSALKEQSKEQKTYVSVPDHWVTDRVAAAEKRMLQADASKLVWQSIEAHGGLSRWYSNGVLSFRFNYMPLKGGKQRDTHQWIDTWSSRAYHESKTSPDVTFGWTGKEAWISPNGADGDHIPRFWSLTPYYFVGVPFVFADEGINYELLEDEIIESAIHHKVKITYDQGVGDAPDDYYILYIDEGTKKVDAIIYVVSYPKFFPNGGHSEEKFMDYIGEREVDGILLAQEYKTYLRKGKKGFVKHVTDIALSDVSFSKKTPVDFFEMPKGAVTISN